MVFNAGMSTSSIEVVGVGYEFCAISNSFVILRSSGALKRDPELVEGFTS